MAGFILIDGINDLKEKQRINANKFNYENINADQESNDSGELSCGQVLIFILSRWTEACLIIGKNKFMNFNVLGISSTDLIMTKFEC